MTSKIQLIDDNGDLAHEVFGETIREALESATQWTSDVLEPTMRPEPIRDPLEMIEWIQSCGWELRFSEVL